MAGFVTLAVVLQAPSLATSRAKSPIVSAGYLKYSRFWETTTGDRVRSALRGRHVSVGPKGTSGAPLVALPYTQSPRVTVSPSAPVREPSTPRTIVPRGRGSDDGLPREDRTTRFVTGSRQRAARRAAVSAHMVLDG